MLVAYFKAAWRSVKKYKTFSAINIFGLSIGIAAFLLIASYLRFEYNYDEFPNRDRIFRVPMVISKKGEKEQAFAYTYPAVASALKEDLPEIEETARMTEWGGIVTYGDKMISESKSTYYTDPSFFRIFSFRFIEGNASTALKELNDAVITSETAKKYFGNVDPVGKALHYQKQDYVVTSVIELPPNSHFKFNILLNHDKLTQRIPVLNTMWSESHFYTYVLTRPGTNAKTLQSKLSSFAERHLGARMKSSSSEVKFFLQPLKDIHLRSTYDYEFEGNGNFTYLKYLGIAAVFILLIGWINYVNLSTAISLDRFKEVGVRKVLGAGKFQLVRQFLTESLFLNILAILLGVSIFKIALPFFSELVQKDVSSLNSSDWMFWLFSLAVVLLGTFVSAFYPAFVLSSFQPLYAIKSSENSSVLRGGKTFLRKSLVVFQFTTAIVLIAAAIGFYRQLRFMQTRDLGVDIAQTLVLQKTPTYDSSYIRVNTAFINELRSNPSVVSVAASDDVPGSELGTFNLAPKNSKVQTQCKGNGIDEEFVPSYGLQIVAGRNLLPTDRRAVDTNYVENVLVNESAAKLFGFSKPSEILGQEFIASGFIRTRIVGVVKDFHQNSLQYDVEPIFFGPADKAAWQCLSIKLKTANLPRVMDFIKSKWSSFYPEMPYRFFFLDDHFNEQYKRDQLFATMLWLFTIIAIVLACLGLFALSLFTIAKRRREISIRKVLGATVVQVASLVTKDYMQLVVISTMIALPLAFVIVNNWLKGYAYRISVGLWFFFLPALLIVLIALITVLYQSVKAASANPVKNLRTE